MLDDGTVVSGAAFVNRAFYIITGMIGAVDLDDEWDDLDAAVGP